MDEDEVTWQPETSEVGSLLSVVEQEHQMRRESREAVYDRPLEERVAAGLALQDLRFAGAVEDRAGVLLLFHGPRNDSRLRPGARLRLSRGDPRKAAALLELVSDRFDGQRYEFRLSGQVEDPASLDTEETWVLDEDLFDLYEAQVELLRCAEKVGLAGWLSGGEPVRDPLPPDHESPFARGLEDSMLEGFMRSLAARDWFAVQGPPGTGKTHLLARIALHYALDEHARVLITAVSHQAIHNALAETYFVGRKMRSERGTDDLLAEGFFKLGASKGHNEGLPEGVRPTGRLAVKKSPLIVGATVYAAAYAAARLPGGDLASRKPPFDVVLFDEAGQAPLTLALGARLLGKKAVFIGDDAQMPPIVELPPDEDRPKARQSVIAHLRRAYEEPFLLAESRRLNEELCSVISDCFYGGRLGSTPEAAERRFALPRKPRPEFEELLGPEHSFLFLDVPHEDCRSSSEKEAHWAAALAREAVRCGLRAEEVGVIAPYRAQCNRIRFLLEDPRILCSTVERFQGQERELVVISLTSSLPSYLARLAAFLFEPNRLNVAISRARTKVVLLGSRKALSRAAEQADADSPQAEGLGIFLKLLGRAHPADGSALPALAPAAAPEAEGLGTIVFEPGDQVEHQDFGPGVVVRKSIQVIDRVSEWVNEIRFQDGRTRTLIPRLSKTPMKRIR
ncbi:MAG TPA: hypothetical protein DCM05_17215 [Elusimicrobia bacterium]|nr:hypothetical protein [Elusimicrobiota bacterium]